jgi:hypothetical protein
VFARRAQALGFTPLEAADGLLLPTALLARTVNVYVVPLLSPATVALLLALPTLAVKPPGEELTV